MCSVVFTMVRRKMRLILISASLILGSCFYQFLYLGVYIEDVKRMHTQVQLRWRIGPDSTTNHADIVKPLVAGCSTVKKKRNLKIVGSSFLSREKTRILAKRTKPLLTIFTTWTTNPEKNLVHTLTSHNWMEFRPFIIPVVFTNKTSIAQACKRKGFVVHNIRKAAAGGVPLLKYMYLDSMEHYDSIFYAYSNSDILFTENLLITLYSLINVYIDIYKPVLIVGRRTDVINVTIQEGYLWRNIKTVAKRRGELHKDYAVDYFITSRSYPWKDIAPVIVGRITYDNYLLYYSRKAKYTVIDATKTLLALHQVTASGNYEGHRHANKNYNLNILQKMFNHTRFQSEAIHCVNKYTYYRRGKVELSSRIIQKPCKD